MESRTRRWRITEDGPADRHTPAPGSGTAASYAQVTTASDPRVAMENELRKLAGVVGVVVITDDHADPIEIQVFTQPSADLQRTREGATRIRDRHGFEEVAALVTAALAHPISSGAESGAHDRDAAVPHGVGSQRLGLQQVQVSSHHGRSIARVHLGLGRRESIGEARGGEEHPGRPPHDRLELIVLATLRAVGTLAGASAWIEMIAVSVTEMDETRVVSVLLSENGEDTRELVGTCVTRDRSDQDEAAARATLDAVNRRLTDRIVDRPHRGPEGMGHG